jgi:thiol-disulfide isomerase/thioredoxin
MSRGRLSPAGLITAALLAASSLAGSARAAIPTTAPAMAGATTPPARDRAAIEADLKRVGAEVGQAMPRGTLSDPTKRAAAAPTAIPLVRQQQALFTELATTPQEAKMYSSIQQQLTSTLYLLGDKETVARVDAAAGSTVVADSLPAQGVQLRARWLGAGHDAAAQQPIADELARLDAAHPDDADLTILTYSMAATAASPDLKSGMMDAVRKMTNPTAVRIATAGERRKSAEAKLNGLAGQPLTVTGTTVDGKPFSSEQYKGKVVLVDFWATWCGPCKAELPRVKDVYGKYHDKGLEIVGVSNDYKADALRKYTAENGMPWVELLDAPAAADHQWNPTTLGYGINGIPTMFLIDKKGVCRTVEARESMEDLIPKLLAE